jgi:hypothetical protein
MKAHDLGFQFFDERAKLGIEGTTDCARWRHFSLRYVAWLFGAAELNKLWSGERRFDAMLS